MDTQNHPELHDATPAAAFNDAATDFDTVTALPNSLRSPGNHSSTSVGSAFSAAIRFFVPIGPGAPCKAAVHWFVPLGLATGLLWAATFRASWRLYGEIGSIRLIPALAVVLLESFFTGPFLALGLARTAHLLTGKTPLRSDGDPLAPLSPVGTYVLIIAVLTQWALIVSMQAISPWYPPHGDWRRPFVFMYPAPIYRPLVLAPIWGRWAVLLAASVGRTARDADPTVKALGEAVRPGVLLWHSILPMAMTAIYCSRDQNLLLGVIIGLLVFAMTYFVTVVMARRGGGQTRQSLYAAAQIGQLAFLAFYRAFWSVMHG